VYPSPYENQEAFVKTIKEEAVRLGSMPVVYACSDATFLALYRYREELRDFLTIVYPEARSIEIAFDKAATYSLANVSGVPTIPTYIPETESELDRVSETVVYPVVVKTRRSVTWNDGVGVFGSASFVHDARALKELVRELTKKLREAPLIQTFIRGEEYGVEMLSRDGAVYALVVHHRVRSLSPTGGASVLKEVLEDGYLKETLVAHAQRLVHELVWTGPIMVEFKVDADSRTPYLMEINGRFWGSLPLSVYAGVDIPLLYHRTCEGEELPNSVSVPSRPTTSVHQMGEVLHLLRVLFHSDMMRTVLYPPRRQALRNFFSLPRGVVDDVWAKDDRWPSFMEIIDILKSKFWK
jgi:predicted ATP-grasp superfamily ATP-dependent carboligase